MGEDLLLVYNNDRLHIMYAVHQYLEQVHISVMQWLACSLEWTQLSICVTNRWEGFGHESLLPYHYGTLNRQSKKIGRIFRRFYCYVHEKLDERSYQSLEDGRRVTQIPNKFSFIFAFLKWPHLKGNEVTFQATSIFFNFICYIIK